MAISNILCLEIDFPELDLTWPLFYAQRVVPIPAISIGQFRGTFAKCEAFDVQKLNKMTLFQFHRRDAFPFLMIYVLAMPVILARENFILSQKTLIFRGY
jgi:hypothetical protein